MKDGHLEVKDLMIGDWVMVVNYYIDDETNKKVYFSNSPNYLLVAGIFDDVIATKIPWIDPKDGIEYDEAKWDELSPVPLTPEILNKNGFEKEKYNMYTAYYFPNNDDLQNRGFALEECNNIHKITDHQLMPIRYVHELQRLLRSCEDNSLRSLADNFKI